MSQPLLNTRALCKGFLSGDRRIEVLRGIDFDVHAGESVSVRGESGSGKSTFLNLISGLDAPDSGEVLWEGHADIEKVRRAGRIGIVFQAFCLIPEIDTFNNVLMASRVLGQSGPAERERAAALLDKVGLGARMKHLPNQLSGGEKQRVALARALLNRPGLIVADEPTGNLDERTGDAAIELLLQLCDETSTALVLVTHNATHAARAKRSLTLHDGLLR